VQDKTLNNDALNDEVVANEAATKAEINEESRDEHAESATVVSPVEDRDLAYVDDVNAALLLKTPKHTQRLLYLIVALIVSAIVWAGYAELDEVTVGEGKVIPSRQLQIIQNLEGGILSEIFVREGDAVEVGQSLLRIDDTRFRSELRESEQGQANLQGQIARYRAELQSVLINSPSTQEQGALSSIEQQPLALPDTFLQSYPNIVARQNAALSARLNNLQSKLNVIERQLSQKAQEKEEVKSKVDHLAESFQLVNEELLLTTPMVADGVVSRVELIKLQRQVNEMKSELASNRFLLPKVEFAIQELRSKHREAALKFKADTRDALNELEGQYSQVSEANINLQDRVDRTIVTSPVRGKVKQINITTVGGVIQPGMDIVEIVPVEDNLLIEAQILPKDIAFLRPGLTAVVKFTAYDFSTYGGLKGTLEHISADTIQDEEGNSFYLVRIRTTQSFLGDEHAPLPIIPGMLAQVDLITGKKSVLDYLLKPILRVKQEALRER